MEPNNVSPQSGSIVLDSNLIYDSDNSVIENPSKVVISSSSSSSSSSSTSSVSSSDDDEGFVSGGEEFGTASENLVVADGNLEDEDEVAEERPVFVKMPVAIVTNEDEEEVRVLGGDDVAGSSGVRVLSGGDVAEDGIVGAVEAVVIEPVLKSAIMEDETSEVRVLSENTKLGVVESVSCENSDLDAVVKFFTDCDGEKEGESKKSDTDEAEEVAKTEVESVIGGGESVAQSVEDDVAEPKAVVVEEKEDEREVSVETREMDSVGEKPKAETLESEDLDVNKAYGEEAKLVDVVELVNGFSEASPVAKKTNNPSNDMVERAVHTVDDVDVDVAEKGVDIVDAVVDDVAEREVVVVDAVDVDVAEKGVDVVDDVAEREVDIVDDMEAKEASPDMEKADNSDNDDEKFEALVNEFNQTSINSVNVEKIETLNEKSVDVANSDHFYAKEEELEADFDAREEFEDSEEETDGMIFGSSQAAKQFMEELEREAGSGSNEIDGQIVTDSDEEAESEGEDEKEVFDSAAFAALLKAATGGGGGSDGGNITITSQDGSRLFSIERPAGLGSSVRSAQPMGLGLGRANRPALFTPPSVETEKELSPEEKKKLESLQNLRIKFLRLVQRLGASPENSVAAQVLYRLAIVAGRPNNRPFSLDDAKTAALELEVEGKDDLDFSINILVLGKCGVGKSSTINSIFGEEKSKIVAFEPGTTSVREIVGIVDGVKVRVIDTPGLKSAVMEQGFNHKVLSSVKRFMKKSPPDIILYVDRLDTQTRDLNDLPMLKTITGALGSATWRNAIVALTHGASAPPEGPNGNPLNYEVSVTQRSHVVQQSIGHAVGDSRMMSPSLMNPVSLVENHPLCRTNREGQKVLPNGQTWRPQLLLLCYSMKILAEANLVSKPQDPFDHRKLFGFRVRSPPLPYLLSSMLQSRAHPKLPSDQGIDNGDSDADLADFSDSDNDDEEDEYDQLPPFKPLRKAQIDKLSKEQRKAYFEEFDYRVKLLQKKQWREEVKRVKEMKKREKGAAPREYDEFYQEAEGAAPVATPLPDMVLPPSFDSDNPAYRYRFLEPTSQFLARPVLDTHGWDHDCGYDGINLEQSLAIAGMFPAKVSVQVTKDKKDFSLHLDSSVAAKHGDNGSTMAGFDIQNVGKQLAYIVRGETKFKNLKKNKTAAGVSVTFLGENVATGVKIEDQIALGKQWAVVGSTGTVRCQGDAAYGANFEVQRREIDYPIGQVQSTYGLSLIKWRGDWALGFNSVAQFAIGRNSKVAIRTGINNKLSGQITARTSSSDHLSLVLVAVIPIASAIYKKIWPPEGDNYSIY